MSMRNDKEKLIQAVSFLRGAIMMAEGSLSVGADSMLLHEITEVRKGRDVIREIANLVEDRLTDMKDET